MSEVVCQADGFYEIFIAAKGTGKCPPDLSNFKRMGEARSEVVAFKIDKDLRFIFESPECRCM